MPKSNDFDQLLRMIDSVNNAIRAHNDFANQRIFKFRHDSTQFRGLRQKSGSRNKKSTETNSFIRVIDINVTDNITKVSAR